MTCKSFYCQRAADCKDTRCPGHPGDHCRDLKVIDDAIGTWLTSLGWALLFVFALLSSILIWGLL